VGLSLSVRPVFLASVLYYAVRWEIVDSSGVQARLATHLRAIGILCTRASVTRDKDEEMAI
jgi:hypothetical protein